MERFNEVVNGLKEGKQEMAKQVKDLATAIDALSAKIKVMSHFIKVLPSFNMMIIQERNILKVHENNLELYFCYCICGTSYEGTSVFDDNFIPEPRSHSVKKLQQFKNEALVF